MAGEAHGKIGPLLTNHGAHVQKDAAAVKRFQRAQHRNDPLARPELKRRTVGALCDAVSGDKSRNSDPKVSVQRKVFLSKVLVPITVLGSTCLEITARGGDSFNEAPPNGFYCFPLLTLIVPVIF